MVKSDNYSDAGPLAGKERFSLLEILFIIILMPVLIIVELAKRS